MLRIEGHVKVTGVVVIIMFAAHSSVAEVYIESRIFSSPSESAYVTDVSFALSCQSSASFDISGFIFEVERRKIGYRLSPVS